MSNLESILSARTATAAPELVEDLGGEKLRCLACAHRCSIPEGRPGICRVRRNSGGTLVVPNGYVSGVQVDPIEKKPFFHVIPGSDALSFGMLGCNLHCAYCQNWLTSQALKDDRSASTIRGTTAADLVRIALDRGAPVVTSTYNEPLITAEWAAEVFDLARTEGLWTSLVSNGNATPEVLDYLAPRLDLMKVDLKAFRDVSYRRLGGRLSSVLETIEGVHARGIWLEVVTLVVPGLNDSDEELRDIAGFLSGISPGIPWHVTAFHPNYKMQDRGATSLDTLLRACDIGRDEGLSFVYPGNIAGRAGDRESTSCPACGFRLVERVGYRVGASLVTPDGRCPECAAEIPGRWHRES